MLDIMERARRWCFTLNNHSIEERDSIYKNDNFGYLIMGEEIAPTTGTPHLQGYVELADRGKTMTALKKSFGIDRIHLERSKGNSEQNIIYCKKNNVFWSAGIPRKLRAAERIWKAFGMM